MITFHNHCTKELHSEAKRIIDTKSWHPKYKEQLLSRVVDMMEVGQMVRTETGSKTVAFKLNDVDAIVTVVSDRDS